MGKKKSRSKQVSKGEVGNPTKTRLRFGEAGYEQQKMLNKWRAFQNGKNVVITIENPNKNETNKPYIRVPAKDVWRASSR